MLAEKLHCQLYNQDASALLFFSIIYYLSTGKEKILFVFLISSTFYAHCKCPEIKESLQVERKASYCREKALDGTFRIISYVTSIAAINVKQLLANADEGFTRLLAVPFFLLSVFPHHHSYPSHVHLLL
jgi:hypothetical protein